MKLMDAIRAVKKKAREQKQKESNANRYWKKGRYAGLKE